MRAPVFASYEEYHQSELRGDPERDTSTAERRATETYWRASPSTCAGTGPGRGPACMQGVRQ
jgi:hypothetical protein